MASRKYYYKTPSGKNKPVSNLISNERSGARNQTHTLYVNAEETTQCFSPKLHSSEINKVECQKDVCKKNKLDVYGPIVTRMVDGKSSTVKYEEIYNMIPHTTPDMICTPPPHSLGNQSFEKVSHSLSPKITRRRKTLCCCKHVSFESNGPFHKRSCNQHVCEVHSNKENKTIQSTSFCNESLLKLQCSTPEHHDNLQRGNSSYTSVVLHAISHDTPKAPQRRHRCNLLYSILDGNMEQVKIALNNGEDPNASLNVPEWVMGEACRLLPILLASKLAYPTIVQLLLKYGAVCNSVNNQGQNALHLLFSPHPSTREFHAWNNHENTQTTEPIKNISIQKSWEDLESYFKSLPSLDNETYDVYNTEPMVINDSTFMLNFDLPDFKKYFIPKVKRSDQAMMDDICKCTEILLKHGIHTTRKDILGKTPWDVASQNPLLSNNHFLLEKLKNIDQPLYYKTKNETKPSSLCTSLIQIHSNPLVPIAQSPSCCT